MRKTRLSALKKPKELWEEEVLKAVLWIEGEGPENTTPREKEGR